MREGGVEGPGDADFVQGGFDVGDADGASIAGEVAVVCEAVYHGAWAATGGWVGGGVGASCERWVGIGLWGRHPVNVGNVVRPC